MKYFHYRDMIVREFILWRVLPSDVVVLASFLPLRELIRVHLLESLCLAGEVM